MSQRACAQCGASCDDGAPKRGRPPRYCSAECRSAQAPRYRATYRRALHRLSCAYCGQAFESLEPSQRYCSRACGAHAPRPTRRTGRRVRPCSHARCSATAEPGRRLCSLHHQRLKRGLQNCEAWGCRALGVRDGWCIVHAPIQISWRQCECGGWYVARGTRVHCRRKYAPRPATPRPCRACGGSVVLRWTPEAKSYCPPCLSEQRRAIQKVAKLRREGRLRGQRVEVVWRRRVYERDHWRCLLCGKSVARGAVVPHPGAPTLDHIVPLSAGGEHSYANVQTAHFRCNSLRGAHGPAQMRLAM